MQAPSSHSVRGNSAKTGSWPLRAMGTTTVELILRDSIRRSSLAALLGALVAVVLTPFMATVWAYEIAGDREAAAGRAPTFEFCTAGRGLNDGVS